MADNRQNCGKSREERVKAIIGEHTGQERSLLAVLHAVQSLDGQNFLAEDELVWVAEGLGIPISKVYGVATFYSLYSVKPRGKYIIRVCENAPCHVVGAEQIIATLIRELQIDFGETTPDGRFTLELTSCLGVCGVAPAMMINDDVHGNLSPDQLRSILELYQ